MLNTIEGLSNWLPVLNGQLTDKFVESLESEVKASVGMQIFNVTDSDNYNSAYQILPSISGVQKIAQGSDFAEIGGDQGYKKTYTTSRYGAAFVIPKEEYRFLAQKYSEIMQRPEDLVTDCMSKIDQSMADVLLNGRSTTYTDVYGETVDATTPDGVAFFSASHKASSTSSTFSNIIVSGGTTNPALARDAVVAGMVQGMNFTNSAGQSAPVMFDTLIVGPSNYDLAWRIVNSDLLQGSPNNDKNGMVKKLNVVLWERLGSTTKWFLMDSKKAKKKTLMMKFGQRPILTTPDVLPKNQALYYACDYMNHLVIGDPRFVFGSEGDNT